MNIQELVSKAIQEMDIEKIITEKTQEVIKGTLESIISDTFKSWSDFGKELKEKMSAELKINLKEIKLDEYNQVIIALLKQSLKENATDNLYFKEKIDKLIKQIAETDIKPEYKLSEIVSLYKEEFNEDAQEDKIEEMYLKVDYDKYSTRIYLDKQEVDYDFKAEVRFYIDNETGKISNLHLEGDVTKGKSIYRNRIYGVDKLLYQIYLLGAKVIIDEKNCDLYYDLDDED